MIIINTHTSTLNPAKLISSVLNEYGISSRVTTTELFKKTDTVINYGVASDAGIINTQSFVILCGNKYNFSRKLLDNGFVTPNFSVNFNQITKYPIVLRKTLHGHGGEGIVFIENKEELDIELSKQPLGVRYSFTDYYSCQFELRCHILGGKIARIFKKVKDVEEKYPIRNTQNGYHYSLRNIEQYQKVIRLVDSLNPILGSENFYALDLGYVPELQTYVIFEANSAPGLNTNTAKLYADYLKNYLKL